MEQTISTPNALGDGSPQRGGCVDSVDKGCIRPTLCQSLKTEYYV